MKSKQYHLFQSGRSMIEMLCVLAIVGVLSIGAVMGLRYLFIHHKANAVLSDVSLAFSDLVTREDEDMIDAYAVHFTPESGKAVLAFRDTNLNDFVEVRGVEQTVCGVLMRYKHVSPIDTMYDDAGNEITAETCQDNITMIFGYKENVSDPSVGPGADPCDTLVCDEGYHCERGRCVADPNPCVGVECQNGGTCNSSGECQCVQGYTGDRCQTAPECNQVEESLKCPSPKFCNPDNWTCECPASPANCNEYDTSTCRCTDCAEGYKAEDGKCENCADGYIKFNEKCTKDCVASRVLQNCSAGSTSETCTTCTACTEGHSLQDGACCVTVEGCKTYDITTENCTCTECNEGYLFDSSTNACVKYDGLCEYAYENPVGDGVKEADCIYKMDPIVGTSATAADCSYQLPQITGTAETAADCWYSNANPTGSSSAPYNTVLNMTAGQGCPSGQYCYLKYTAKGCGSEVGAAGQATIYGRCTALSSTESTCKSAYTKTLTMTPIDSCASGQYCVINWKEEGCSNGLSADASGKVWGRCQTMSSTDATCRVAYKNVLTMSATKSCPSNQYCVLNWKETGCSNGLSADASGELYGRCQTMSSTDATCKVAYNTTLSMTATKACPSNKYCHLKWSTPCPDTTDVGATGANPFHGVCLDMNDTNATCPTPTSQA